MQKKASIKVYTCNGDRNLPNIMSALLAFLRQKQKTAYIFQNVNRNFDYMLNKHFEQLGCWGNFYFTTKITI